MVGSGWTVVASWPGYRGPHLAWSPDGGYLLVKPEVGTAGVYTAAGEEVASFEHTDWAEWLDSERLMLIERDRLADGSEGASFARIATLDGERPAPVDVPRGWTMANGHGAVAFIEEDFVTGDDCGFGCPVDTYRVWSNVGISPVHSGGPVGWSLDGSKLFVVHDRHDPLDVPIGAPAPEWRRGWLEVLAWPGLETIARLRDVEVLDHDVQIDPSGRFLGFDDPDEADELTIVDTQNGKSASFGTGFGFVWTADGRIMQIPRWFAPVITYDRKGEVLDSQLVNGTTLRLVGSPDGTVVLFDGDKNVPIKVLQGDTFADIEPVPALDQSSYCDSGLASPSGSSLAVACPYPINPDPEQPNVQVVFVRPMGPELVGI